MAMPMSLRIVISEMR